MEMLVAAALVAAALFVAYANGANDNFKGVATLYGSGLLGYRGALAWATVTTAAGSLCSVFLAEKLVKAFSGKGLVPDAVAADPGFLTAVAIGAAVTVFTAALTGFPISTTHALTGGLVGAGLAASGAGVNFARLGGAFFLPLLASPFLAVALAGTGHWLTGRLPSFASFEPCLCIDDAPPVMSASLTSAAALAPAPLRLHVGEARECHRHGRGGLLRLGGLSAADGLHVLSAGAVSFARGLNDTPKVVGLLVVLRALDVRIGLLAIAGVMALGGVLHAGRIAETVGRRITSMKPDQGLVANLVTAGLVTTASYSGLPVSTTHVSCGSIFGIGLASRNADTSVIRRILASWVLTLPVAAAVAGAAAILLSR